MKRKRSQVSQVSQVRILHSPSSRAISRVALAPIAGPKATSAVTAKRRRLLEKCGLPLPHRALSLQKLT
jgi:hypothetical protein